MTRPRFSHDSFLARAIALTLAVWSHGPKAGAPADRCFPARADHFLRYLSTGANPPVDEPAEPATAYCAICDASEACHYPGGSRYGDHTFINRDHPEDVLS